MTGESSRCTERVWQQEVMNESPTDHASDQDNDEDNSSEVNCKDDQVEFIREFQGFVNEAIKRLLNNQEGSEHAQRKIEETAQYWAAQEKKAAMNYCCALKLNNTVSNKRVQQLYSEDQPQEVIDQAEQQAGSAR